MNNVITSIAIVTTCLALAACGGPEHPPKDGHGPKHKPGHHLHGMVVPAASPSINFKVSDKAGNTMELAIECGADTSLKQCAQVNQSIIDKVSKMRAGAQR